MAHILYIGDSNPGSTSAHRAGALQRLGHVVMIRNPYEVFTSRRFEPIHLRTGYRLVQRRVIKWVNDLIKTRPQTDLVWVDGGELLGPGCFISLRALQCPVLLYNVDDPTGHRDGRKFDLLLKSLTLYDHVVVVRKESENECIKLGAKQVTRVLRSYDEVMHKPFDQVSDIPLSFRSDVAFIGTWMRHEKKREEIFLELIKNDVPFRIWGDRWHKSSHWELLKPFYAGKALSGRDYVAAIQGAKVCLGLLSKGNRDLHTQRTLEIPYAGGLFCAERTVEHQEIYKEGVEAMFWSDAKECAAVCKQLLDDDHLRESIRLAGMKKVRAIGVGNEDICQKIINEIQLLDKINLTIYTNEQPAKREFQLG